MTGAELRALRQALKLSQAALAARLGVPTNTIARWERDELTIRHPALLAMAMDHLSCKPKRRTK